MPKAFRSGFGRDGVSDALTHSDPKPQDFALGHWPGGMQKMLPPDLFTGGVGKVEEDGRFLKSKVHSGDWRLWGGGSKRADLENAKNKTQLLEGHA